MAVRTIWFVLCAVPIVKLEMVKVTDRIITSNTKRINVTVYFHKLGTIRQLNRPSTVYVHRICLRPVWTLKRTTFSFQFTPTIRRRCGRGKNGWECSSWGSGCFNRLKGTPESPATGVVTGPCMEHSHGQVRGHL